MASRKAKLKLRDLSRLQPEFQEARDVRSSVLHKKEHPIATAILGAVMVEHELEKLLRSKFKRKDDETWKMLVADNGPLNSFSSKIVAGYALGIYDKSMRDDLHIVRSIRNAFAHSKKLIQFDHLLIVKELGKSSTKFTKVEPSRAASEYAVLCCRLSTQLIHKSKSYRRAMSPLAALFTPPPGGKDK
jgi:DNA-binding MltR family transcriptional regulator